MAAVDPVTVQVKVEVAEVERIKLEPGDVLHLHFEDPVPMATIQAAAEQLREIFGEGKTMVTQGNVSTAIVRCP
ncbi:MAG TPA: hypothetical protein VMF31_10645 [Solirubrobacterales bacterium]|nr:hypothetical protein [Solirubrobacterales bacterium]